MGTCLGYGHREVAEPPVLSEPEEVKKLMKVPLMDTTQVLLAQMLGTGLQDLSWAKGEGELQPWPRAPSPPGVGTADTQWEWQAGLCKASAPTPSAPSPAVLLPGGQPWGLQPPRAVRGCPLPLALPAGSCSSLAYAEL